MRISITVHGHLRHTSAIGKDEMSFTLPDAGGLRIRDLLETLNIIEEEVKQTTVNGRPARLDEQVRHRAKLDFYPKRG